MIGRTETHVGTSSVGTEAYMDTSWTTNVCGSSTVERCKQGRNYNQIPNQVYSGQEYAR